MSILTPRASFGLHFGKTICKTSFLKVALTPSVSTRQGNDMLLEKVRDRFSTRR
jgi:hypothetical protein